MSDPAIKLRAYLDQTVERVDVDDVFARARVRRQWHPSPFVNWRPAWIATAAALIIVISIGAVAAGAWLLRGEGIADFIRQPDSDTGPPGWSNVIILGLAIGGGAIALLAGANTLSNIIHRMRDRRNAMQTIESPERELARLREDNARLGSAKRSLIAALVVLLIAGAAAGAWLIVDNAGTATERQIDALIDDYYAAWDTDNNEALLELLTEDAVLYGNNGGTYTGEMIEAFATMVQGFHPERVGDTLILNPTIPDTTGWFVASYTRALDHPEGGDIHEMDLFKVVEQDGEYLIQVHETWLAGE